MYYYLDNNGTQQGPVDKNLLRSLGVTADTMVWKKGLEQWVKASLVPDGVATPGVDDIIVNLAAIHRTPGHPDYAYYETNILGAKNISDFAARYGVRRMVFTSSIAPYAASEETIFSAAVHIRS